MEWKHQNYSILQDRQRFITSLVSQLYSKRLFLAQGTQTLICEMYSASTDNEIKNDVLSAFSDPYGASCSYNCGNYSLEWVDSMQPMLEIGGHLLI